MSNDIIFDKRLQEKHIRDGKLTTGGVDDFLAALPDVSEKLLTFDADGNATNMPQRTLKELAIKPGEPESKTAPIAAPADPLAGLWDDPIR